jgi:hypothetical protein
MKMCVKMKKIKYNNEDEREKNEKNKV